MGHWYLIVKQPVGGAPELLRNELVGLIVPNRDVRKETKGTVGWYTIYGDYMRTCLLQLLNTYNLLAKQLSLPIVL